MCVCECGCVFVCVCQRERERERERMKCKKVQVEEITFVLKNAEPRNVEYFFEQMRKCQLQCFAIFSLQLIKECGSIPTSGHCCPLLDDRATVSIMLMKTYVSVRPWTRRLLKNYETVCTFCHKMFGSSS